MFTFDFVGYLVVTVFVFVCVCWVWLFDLLYALLWVLILGCCLVCDLCLLFVICFRFLGLLDCWFECLWLPGL